jgi:Ni/Fe-hydrogenase subunit HybB-like protein/Fe-S-cluster-containing dehydrogenase component
MPITRRTAIGVLAVAGATTLLPKGLSARPAKAPGRDAVGLLYDPTLCIGCRDCVRGCAEASGCDPEAAMNEDARLSTGSFTVLRRYDACGTRTFRKIQCMHCVDPACVSACALTAMVKCEDGSVVWNGDLCLGCRYCQVACPFNIPRFEFEKAIPELTKCDLCPERRAEGLQPACVERCKRGALLFGQRADLLAEAHRRIGEHPELYNPKVYGEFDGGGTSALYLAPAGVAFTDLGLPELGTRSVPSLPETIQHTLYKGFIAPMVLLGTFGAVVRRNVQRMHSAEAASHDDNERMEPVEGKLLTWPFAILVALTLVGVAGVLWRLIAGLGATTNLNDGYAKGLWIALNVVTGTGLACGGYAIALLVYLANRGRYHPLVRAAIAMSALGYTLGGLSVLIDIGRVWNFYKLPLYFWQWNFNSILLEVALCIMLYTTVVWLELSPAFFDRWKDSRFPGLRRLAAGFAPKIERAMPYLIAVGLLLPTMHQSSLGSMMLLAGSKLHPLWQTPLLPALFLVSVVGIGYAAVSLETLISSRVFKRPEELPMLRALAAPIAGILLAFAALRLGDLALHDKLGHIRELDVYATIFLVEMALFVLPALVLLARRRTAGSPLLMTLAVMVIGGGALYRFSAYLLAFNPGPEWAYFPSLWEIAISVGIIAAELMGYVILVKKFPILRGAPAARLQGPWRSDRIPAERMELIQIGDSRFAPGR